MWLLLPAVLALVGLLAADAVDAAPAATAVLRTGLPDRALTPGVTNPAVTQATIHSTICVSGWTATIRPPSSYTNALKRSQIAAYGYSDTKLADYEEDHLISLELGGSPRSAKNLWPEPHHIRLANGTDVGSYAKDGFENALKRKVCAGTLSLASAQREIALNWVKYWRLGQSGGAAPPPAPIPTPAPTPTPIPIATPTPTPTPSASTGVCAGLPGDIVAACQAGASAVCRDGTWSYSANRSGTFSHHGGVYWWTGNLGPAGPG
jgi:hypothetical protein